MSEIGKKSTNVFRANGLTTNSKINKLISCIESEKSHKSIVLLLIELAENHELSSDNSISLQYYLDMFQNLNGEPPLSETGILLLNSAIIYGRSVDSVHFTVKKLLLSLINPENKPTERFEQNLDISAPHTLNAVAKGRKRPLEEFNKTYDIEMNIKRFKSTSNNNRFEEGLSFSSQKENEIIENVIKTAIDSWIKDYTHPLTCHFSAIEDFDYEEEVDLKKKYKLLNNHLEHRYNTLTPDINFKMYFKIKDYIDAVYNDSANANMWPVPSDAYIQRFVNLENQILNIESYSTCDEYATDKINIIDNQVLTACGAGVIETNSSDFCTHTDNDMLLKMNEPDLDILNCKNSLNRPSLGIHNEISSHGRDDLCQTIHCPTEAREDLTAVKVILPHLDDEGVYFSELNARDQQMLSPAVIATDMFRCVKDKSNVVVIIDDVLKRIYNIQEPNTKMLMLPISRQEKSSVSVNFLKIDHKCFKKRRIFKLGPDFHLLKQERLKKIPQKQHEFNHSQMYFRLCEDVSRIPISPVSSPNYEPDFLGFPDEISLDKNRSLSRDSGISLQIPDNIEQALNDDNSNQNMKVVESNTNILSESFAEQNTCSQSFSGEIPHINIAKDVKLTDNIASLMTKVQQWHLHLQPLLMQSKHRHHFDIVKLGRDILNHFEQNNQHDNIISFQNVMENKDSSLVSRYFLSTLLLANQGNIAINISHPDTEEPADLNSIGLRLLNKRRNTYPGEDKNISSSPSAIDKEETKNGVTVTCSKIRTVQQPVSISTVDDQDSGVSMSDGCSL